MTMTFIASANLSGVSSASFQNIPQTFTHLELRFSGKEANNGTSNWYGFNMQINSDTGANYSSHYLYNYNAGGGQTLGSSAEINSTSTPIAIPPRGNGDIVNFGSAICEILDYANTNKYKTMRTLTGFVYNTVPNRMDFISGNWRSTNAITRLDAYFAGNFASGSRLDLYGITTSELTGA